MFVFQKYKLFFIQICIFINITFFGYLSVKFSCQSEYTRNAFFLKIVNSFRRKRTELTSRNIKQILPHFSAHHFPDNCPRVFCAKSTQTTDLLKSSRSETDLS